jgi:hypothetical protein
MTVGVDWASESHHVFPTDADGGKIAICDEKQ